MDGKFRNEKSWNGYNLSELKSAIQKYIRRGNEEKGIYALIELHLFSKLDEKQSVNKKRILTNMKNRLLVIMCEDMSPIDAYRIPIIMKYIEEWEDSNRESLISLVSVYKQLMESKKLRMMSYINSMFLLYSGERNGRYLANYEYLFEDEYLKLEKPEVELEEYIIENKNNWKCFIGIHYIKDMNRVREIIKKIRQKDDNEKRKRIIKILIDLYNKLKLKERFIFLMYCFVLYIHESEINLEKEEEVKLEKEEVSLYLTKNLENKKVQFDDFVYDKHTTNSYNKSIEYFINESSKVNNEDLILKNVQFEKMYKLSKQNNRLYDLYIIEINDSEMDDIKKLPIAQKRTGRYKKYVYMKSNIIIKGPYLKKSNELLNNILNVKLMKEFENQLNINKSYVIDWRCIIKNNNDYYLVMENVGRKINESDIELMETKIEKKLVIKRKTFINRVNDISINDLSEIQKIDVLQYLYFRFLLNIGDSGDHNLLIDKSNNIVGIDMEENINKKDGKEKLDLLFKFISKEKRKIYEKYIEKIKTFDKIDKNKIKNIYENFNIRNISEKILIIENNIKKFKK